MKKIILFDPSYGTLNLGDLIINEALMAEMAPVFNQGFLTRFSTHTPVMHEHQMILPTGMRQHCAEADWKFLGGTNLIKTSLISKKPGWNINPITAPLYRGSIGVGVGSGGAGKVRDAYTRYIYRSALSREYTHSTRDERTVRVLESLDVKAVNTGCPTMWTLTADHCSGIPTKRSANAVFTVTDYAKSPVVDRRVLDMLRENYRETYVWVQGSQDFQYLEELGVLGQVTLINPSVEAYRDFLSRTEVDYVGTRLHAGIYAMRHQRRAIILAVDHRALDIQATHDINVLVREDLTELSRWIDSDLRTHVRLDLDAVRAWKSQFTANE